jgi:hypothetical protein
MENAAPLVKRAGASASLHGLRRKLQMKAEKALIKAASAISIEGVITSIGSDSTPPLFPICSLDAIGIFLCRRYLAL